MPEDPAPFDEHAGRERMAGMIDGHRAGRLALLNALRPELARYYLTVSSDLDVDATEGDFPPSFTIEPVPPPDNPEQNPSYEEGYEDGFDAAWNQDLADLRRRLVDHDLVITDEGSVVTLELATKLIGMFDHHRRSQPVLTPTDDEFHAFLDHEEAAERSQRDRDRAASGPSSAGGLPADVETAADPEHSAAPGPAAASDFESPDAHPVRSSADHELPADPEPPRLATDRRRHRLRRIGSMIRETIDRRTLIATLSAALATSMGWAVFRPLTPPAQTPPNTWQAPQIWNSYPATLRNLFLSWDQAFWTLEQSKQQTVAFSTVFNAMLVPAMDDLKQKQAMFIGTSGRGYCLPALLAGLNPAISNDTARRTIVTAIDIVRQRYGTNVIPGAVKPALQAYLNSGVETHSGITAEITRIIAQIH